MDKWNFENRKLHCGDLSLISNETDMDLNSFLDLEFSQQ